MLHLRIVREQRPWPELELRQRQGGQEGAGEKGGEEGEGKGGGRARAQQVAGPTHCRPLDSPHAYAPAAASSRAGEDLKQDCQGPVSGVCRGCVGDASGMCRGMCRRVCGACVGHVSRRVCVVCCRYASWRVRIGALGSACQIVSAGVWTRPKGAAGRLLLRGRPPILLGDLCSERLWPELPDNHGRCAGRRAWQLLVETGEEPHLRHHVPVQPGGGLLVLVLHGHIHCLNIRKKLLLGCQHLRNET